VLEAIPARFGRAFRMAAGQCIEVVNPHGTQVADTWAFNAHDPFEYLAMDQTRSVNSTIVIRPGTMLVSNRRRPMLVLREDTSPGVHDTLLCACNDAIYRELDCPPDHRSCEQNLHEALGMIGLSIPFTPPPLNLFMNVAVAADGTLVRGAPVARPGDLVRLEASMDLVFVVSACPQDVTPINGALRQPRDLGVRITGGSAA
jgi:uncharacterized protein YcgI (DUF1989 family)